MSKWDKAYGGAATAGGRLFGDQPCEVLREVLARSDVRVGTALCLADGDGRNGTWLAQRGVAVTAVDLSPVATEQARAHDAAKGVTVTRIVADLETWAPPAGQTFDLVALLYLQCESHVRNGALARAWDAVAPGGWVVAEGFASGGDGGLGPGAPDLLYDLAALEATLPGARIVEAFTGRLRLDEGSRHQGTGHVARLLAQKSAR